MNFPVLLTYITPHRRVLMAGDHVRGEQADHGRERGGDRGDRDGREKTVPRGAGEQESACTVAAVSRTEVSVPFIAGESRPGFELRCVISKREELTAKLAELERADPLDSLKARLQAAARDPSGSGRASAAPSDKNKDCGKMTLASLLQGGGCK